MPKTHRLLHRQLRRHLGDQRPIDPALAPLIADISRAYDQADADRALLERSLELTSQELLERNQALSAALREASISVWSWDVAARELSLQGYGPVGFEEVRGLGTYSADAVLARVWAGDRGMVADALVGGCATHGIDIQFRIRSGAGVRWVRMRGTCERGGERGIGVWSDVTAEAEGRLADRRRGESMSRQTHTLQRLAEELAVGTELDTVLARAVADAGATLDVAWTSAWMLEDDGRVLRCAARYAYPSGEPGPLPVFALADHPIYAQAITSQRTIAVSSVWDEPALVEVAPRLAARGVTSILVSACRSNGRVVGVVVAEHIGAPRTWSLDERAFVASVADAVSLAIEGQRRQRAETQRAALEHELRQAQKMESLGLLAGGVAHDFNNLLTPILMCGEMLRDGVVTGDEAQESLRDIITAALDARDLVAQLLAFGRRQVLELRTVDLDDVCERAVKLLARSLPETIAIDFTRGGGRRVRADAGQLQQVVINLAINARDAMPNGGRLRISTHDAPDGKAVVAIEDTGTGIDPEVLPHIFEPFFTTKGIGRGTGLGLSTVYGIVNQHQGTIAVTSELGRGTRFEIRLPGGGPPSRAPSAPLAASPSPRPAGGTVLVVEDEPSVLALVGRVLKREGYQVLAAGSPAAALELAAAHAGPLVLVLTDVVMPEMNGRQLYEQIARDRPGTPVLYMTGYDQEAVTGAVPSPSRVLRKPFALDDLVSAVRSAVA